MEDAGRYEEIFCESLAGLLNHWRVWLGDDELRALHIGFDTSNTEIAVSLLTDREPYLDEQGLPPFGDRWPVADWRLTALNKTFRHGWPDAAELLDWMACQAEQLSTQAQEDFDEQLKAMFVKVVMGDRLRQAFCRFRRIADPLRVRVEMFYDENSPFEASIRELLPVPGWKPASACGPAP